MTSPVTLLGPLTTTWTPPGLCTVGVALSESATTIWQAQTCNPSSNAHDWTDCWPPRASSIPDPGVLMGFGQYSPGYICPAGYSTAARATAGGSTDKGWGIEYSMSDGETAIACCPSGFSPSHISTLKTYAQTCVLTASSTSFSTVKCEDGHFNDYSLVSLPNSQASTYIIFAPLIQLNFQQSDLPAATTSESSEPTSTSASPSSTSAIPSESSTTDSSSSGLSTSNTSGASTATSNGGSPTPSATGGGSSGPDVGGRSSSGGLSSGAKIGIGVGVAVGALVLFIIAFLLYRARRRKQQPKFLPATDPKKLPPPPQAELGNNEVRELEASNEPQELALDPQRRGMTPPSGPIFRPSEGFPYEPPPIFELEGDSTPSTPVRKDNDSIPGTPTRKVL